MFLKQFRFFAFWAFLIGLVAIVFLQFISGQNIRRLIGGNTGLFKELSVQKQLHQLEADVLSIESDVRGAVLTRDSLYLRNIYSKTSDIRNETAAVQKLAGKSMRAEAAQLGVLIEQKIAYNAQILNIYSTKGAASAQRLIQSNRGQYLRDSIIGLIASIDTKRQQNLQIISDSNEASGTQAKTWGIVLSAIACLFIVIAFYLVLQQARQQQKMIDALNESERKTREAAKLKEQFVANMSHEIRTPMNAILGFTGLLRQTPLTEEQKQYIQSMHSASENLLVLINDILDLSKIEAGMMNLEIIKFSLRSLAASVAAMFHEKAKEKKLRLHIHIEEDIPDILNGDALRLTQILVNLLSNAVKFTEAGEITLSIQCLGRTNDKVQLQFIIRDTGIGIPKEKLSSVFERFQQAESSTTRRYGGTGLGLAIVRQLVELQHGHIRLKSKENEGTEFIIDLAYGIVHETATHSDIPVADLLRSDLKGVRVLIAEDNAMNQQLIQHLMKNWGIEYRIVSTGAEAVQELRNNTYSLVLMDIQMPEMDGYTATERIRKDLQSDIPVIAMTAHAMAGEKDRCLEAGMNDYISKPLKDTALYNLILFYVQLTNSLYPVQMHSNGQTVHEGLVNLDYLHQLSGNDSVFEREMLQQFLLQTPDELHNLERAVQGKDFTSIKKIAHSFKSTVGYLGLADTLYPYLDRMEHDSIHADASSIQQDFNYVKEVCEQALREVKSLLAGQSIAS
jgi:signal transduction histidine kinase/DNA-binding response OmpR family regulator